MVFSISFPTFKTPLSNSKSEDYIPLLEEGEAGRGSSGGTENEDEETLVDDSEEKPNHIANASKTKRAHLALNKALIPLQSSTKSFLLFLVPSFLRRNGTSTPPKPPTTPLNPSANPPQPQPPPKNPDSIASLDGLRGYASFGVFILHFTDTFCQMHNRGFGFDKDNHYPIQLPFIHYFWSANSLVATFFIISGYVLSYKPLKLMHTNSNDQFLTTMQSAIFRRGFRLYIPIYIATFISFLMLRVGLFDYPHWVFANGYTVASEDTPVKLETFWLQLKDWWDSMNGMTFLFRWGGGSPGYDLHLWTIPTEFQGSMLTFFVMVGICGFGFWTRTGINVGLAVYCDRFDQNELVRFFLGMVLADLDLYLRDTGRDAEVTIVETRVDGGLGREAESKRAKVLRWLRWPWVLLFVVGWYIAGMPSWDPQVTPGYITMMRVMPSWVRWQTLGCGLLVWSVRNSDDVRILFENRFARYLGKISFAMYLVHGNVRRTVTYALIPTLLKWTNGRENPTGFKVMVIVNAIMSGSVVFFLADLWWRGVDIPSMRFARWLERKLLRKGV